MNPNLPTGTDTDRDPARHHTPRRRPEADPALPHDAELPAQVPYDAAATPWPSPAAVGVLARCDLDDDAPTALGGDEAQEHTGSAHRGIVGEGLYPTATRACRRPGSCTRRAVRPDRGHPPGWPPSRRARPSSAVGAPAPSAPGAPPGTVVVAEPPAPTVVVVVVVSDVTSGTVVASPPGEVVVGGSPASPMVILPPSAHAPVAPTRTRPASARATRTGEEGPSDMRLKLLTMTGITRASATLTIVCPPLGHHR